MGAKQRPRGARLAVDAKWLDRDDGLGPGALDGAAHEGKCARCTAIDDARNAAVEYSAPPATHQLVKASGTLGGQLNLDRLSWRAVGLDADQVSAMDPPAGQRG